jgi:hypothetical protein
VAGTLVRDVTVCVCLSHSCRAPCFWKFIIRKEAHLFYPSRSISSSTRRETEAETAAEGGMHFECQYVTPCEYAYADVYSSDVTIYFYTLHHRTLSPPNVILGNEAVLHPDCECQPSKCQCAPFRKPWPSQSDQAIA